MRYLLFLFSLALAAPVTGQIYIDSYRFGVAAAPGLLLDDYPNSTAAYSLRLLRTAYTGNCIEVRRSNDNATSNIGFSSNYLDTSALKTFCGANNCFVRTWYDQSGNTRNMTSTTDGNQPIIVESGAIIYQGNSPAVSFDGTNDFMESSAALSAFISNTTYNFFGVMMSDTIKTDQSSSFNNEPFWADNNVYAGVHLRRNPNRIIAYNWDGNDDNTNVSINLDTEYIVHQRHESGNLVLSVNNGAESSVASGNTQQLSGSMRLARASLTVYADIFIKEAVWWNTSQSGNISNIYSNINNFYLIY